GRQTGKVVGQRGGKPSLAFVDGLVTSTQGLPSEAVLLPRPYELASVAVIVAVVRPAGAPVEHRIDQDLAGKLRTAAIAGHLRESGGEAPAGAAAHDDDMPRIDTERLCILGQPQQRGIVILLGPRKRRFRG